MPLGLGTETIIGLGHETVWGTPVARTKFIDHTACTLKPTNPLIKGETFRGRSETNYFRGAKKIEGEISSELRYEGWEDLFYHLFLGKVATTTVNTIKQHDFTYDDTVAVPVGLSIEAKYGSAATLVYEGCKVAGATFDFQIDKLLKAAFKIVGEDAASGTATTPTFPAAPIIIWNQIVAMKDASAKEIVSAQVVMDNGFIDDRRVMGSVNVKEHVPSRRSVSGKITAYLENLTDWHAIFAGDTEFALAFTGTGGTIPGSSPSDLYDFILTLPFCKLDDWAPPISDPGPIMQEMSFTCRKGTGGEVVTLRLTNARTTVP
jgi:hypothetical protein